ncbi:MAG: hypothetical protein BWK79_02430 [Beggiatoa sp. IS2]|nr:MAG: hypothetical protein BWK79_02430 [Beggiatoa sp. IS2]
MMQYLVAGGGKIKLTDADFVAEGGEGKIYAHGQFIYKIYTDISKVIPAAKIQELSVLNHPNIIRPQALLLDTNRTAVGFSMQRVQNTVALPRLFTNDFRSQHRLTDRTIIELLEKMRLTTVFIHQHGCLIVDGNEMNYLVDEMTFENPYFIDVDSYQTPSFPATALMLSIRDYHSQHFSMLTDWFAFAIVACQLLIGIHPYKGKHPDFKKHDLAARMQANVSIFNKKVSLPSAVRDFSVIPQAFHDWLMRLLEKGERLPPPTLLGGKIAAVPVQIQVVQGTDYFIISLVREFPNLIRSHFTFNTTHIVLTDQQAYIDTQTVTSIEPGAHIIFEAKTHTPLAVSIRNNLLKVIDLSTNQPAAVTLKADRLLRVGNALYVVYADQLIQVKILHYAGKLLISAGTSWNIMPNAHQVLSGLIYQNVLGKPYLVIPYQNACMIRPIPELAGYKIVSGQHDKGVAMLIGHKHGQYDQLIIRFNENYTAHSVRILDNQEVLDNNFVTLDNGVVIHIPHDGELVIFHRHGDAVKNIQDPQIRTTMRLSHEGNTVLFYTDNKLYRIKVKMP